MLTKLSAHNPKAIPCHVLTQLPHGVMVQATNSGTEIYATSDDNATLKYFLHQLYNLKL